MYLIHFIYPICLPIIEKFSWIFKICPSFIRLFLYFVNINGICFLREWPCCLITIFFEMKHSMFKRNRAIVLIQLSNISDMIASFYF